VPEDESERGPVPSEDARLTSLEERLQQAKLQEAIRAGHAKPDENYRLGMRVLGELIGAPFGGAVIGFVLDRFFDTYPLLLLVFLLLGFAVGIRNVIRLSKTPPGTPPEAGS
jgi:ATP synthase protein I